MRAGAAQKLWLTPSNNNGASEPWLCDLMNSSLWRSSWETTVKPAPESSGPACIHPCDFKALMHHLHGRHHNASHTLPTIQDDKNLQPLLETDTRTEDGICLLGCWSHQDVTKYITGQGISDKKCVCARVCVCIQKCLWKWNPTLFCTDNVIWREFIILPHRNKLQRLETLLPCHVLPEHVQSLAFAPNWRATFICY